MYRFLLSASEGVGCFYFFHSGLAAMNLYYTVVLDLSKQSVWISAGTRSAGSCSNIAS